MDNSAQHWDNIYQTKSAEQLGWFEPDGKQTLKFLDKLALTKPTKIFIAGAGTSSLVDELSRQKFDLVLNDISVEALKQRLNTLMELDIESPLFLHQNLAHPFPVEITESHPIDIWIDRAVLHFLLAETEIQMYFVNLQKMVKQGGYVLLAEFSKSGAEQCAGLSVHQYCIDEMQQRLGDAFELVAYEEYTFINAFGQPKPYVYGLFKRLI